MQGMAMLMSMFSGMRTSSSLNKSASLNAAPKETQDARKNSVNTNVTSSNVGNETNHVNRGGGNSISSAGDTTQTDVTASVSASEQLNVNASVTPRDQLTRPDVSSNVTPSDQQTSRVNNTHDCQNVNGNSLADDTDHDVCSPDSAQLCAHAERRLKLHVDDRIAQLERKMDAKLNRILDILNKKDIENSCDRADISTLPLD